MHHLPASLETLLHADNAVVVKSNLQRTVYHVHFAGNDWHVKVCRVNSWRAWWRDRLRPAKAKLEFTKLHEALRRNVPTIRPVGYAVRLGDSVLVTRTIPDAIPLDHWLDENHTLGPRRRVDLAVELGRTLAAIHCAGVLHPDLHPGNLLIRWTGDRPEFFLIDLHDARIGAPATSRQRIANLVLVNRWFALRTTRTDRLRCWRAYVAATGEIDYFAATNLERLTLRSNQQLWRSRASRCLGDNRRFRRVSGSGVAGHAVVDWRDDELAPILAHPEALFASNDGVLKNSRSSTVAVRDISIGGQNRRVLCKRFRCTSLLDAALSLARHTAALRSWINGHGLREALLPTPRPLLVLQRRRAGMSFDGFLLTEFIGDATDARDALDDMPRRTARFDRVALLIRRLHERGWSHRDLKAPNILFDADDMPALIDLAGAARPRWLTCSRREKDLARLCVSFHDDSRFTNGDKLRFLRIYLNWNVHGQADWKSWWRCIARRMLGKVARNRRRGRPLA